MIKLIRFNSGASKSSVYFDGSNIVVDVIGLKGDYTLVLSDQSGNVMQKKQVRFNTTSQKFVLPAPARIGIYFVRLGNEMSSESFKMFIRR
jgi:hypothetical protein